MRNHRWLIPIILLALALLVPSSTTSAQGPPYHINQWTYGASAGDTSVSASYVLHGTLGQQAVSSSSGLTSTVTGGIWRGASSAAASILVLEKEYRDTTYPVEVGDELTFIVAVTNNGERVQEQVVISDTVPTGLSLVSDSVEAKMGTINVDGDTITLSIEQLTYQQIAILTYRTTVGAGTEGQTITNTATAASSTYGPVTATAVVHIWGGGDVHTLYLPLVALNYSAPTQTVHDLTDAPEPVQATLSRSANSTATTGTLPMTTTGIRSRLSPVRPTSSRPATWKRTLIPSWCSVTMIARPYWPRTMTCFGRPAWRRASSGQRRQTACTTRWYAPTTGRCLAPTLVTSSAYLSERQGWGWKQVALNLPDAPSLPRRLRQHRQRHRRMRKCQNVFCRPSLPSPPLWR